MADKAHRKELLAHYRQNGPEAGVYRIVNQRSQKVLLGSTRNLGSIRGKLDFARTTNSISALDHRLWEDVRQFGIDAFTFEVLERLEVSPERTDAQIGEDLAALEALWRERVNPSDLY